MPLLLFYAVGAVQDLAIGRVCGFGDAKLFGGRRVGDCLLAHYADGLVHHCRDGKVDEEAFDICSVSGIRHAHFFIPAQR